MKAVHPHIRGEYCPNARICSLVIGSSPHPWGILTTAYFDGESFRFIPTSVGNTLLDLYIFGYYPVHPHIRGEYSPLSAPQARLHGSSPHPWGIRESACVEVLRVRFIPTSVGNTVSYVSYGNCDAVHPHIRGEYSISC